MEQKKPETSWHELTEPELLETILGRSAAVPPDNLLRLSEQDPEAFGLLLTVREIGHRIKTGGHDGQGSRPENLRTR